ncbi:hypothetical protein JOM56_008579 [Amanita muscaria]
MTVRFASYRLAFYLAVFLLSGTVLGLAAHFLTLFSSSNHDFPIFATLVPSLNIFLFLLSIQWAVPRTEGMLLALLAALWLTMGAWSTDVIGYVQCDALAGQLYPTKSGSMSLQQYCYEMKVIQAFSWMTFVLVVFALIILFQLATQAQTFGRYNIWAEPIRELPWFGEAPGYYNTGAPGQQYPVGQVPMPYMYPTMAPYGHPGAHSVIVQPGVNGLPPTITQF